MIQISQSSPATGWYVSVGELVDTSTNPVFPTGDDPDILRIDGESYYYSGTLYEGKKILRQSDCRRGGTAEVGYYYNAISGSYWRILHQNTVSTQTDVKDIFVGDKRVYEVVANGELKYWYGGWYKTSSPQYFDSNFYTKTGYNAGQSFFNKRIVSMCYYFAGEGVNERYKLIDVNNSDRYIQLIHYDIHATTYTPYSIRVQLSPSMWANFGYGTGNEEAYFLNYQQLDKTIIEVRGIGGEKKAVSLIAQSSLDPSIEISENKIVIPTQMFNANLTCNTSSNYQSTFYILERS